MNNIKQKIYIIKISVTLRLSHTKHVWAHGSHTVNSVIHGLTGTSIGLQPRTLAQVRLECSKSTGMYEYFHSLIILYLHSLIIF